MITRTTLALLATAFAVLTNAQAQQREPGLLIRLYDVGQNMRWLPEIARGEKPNAVKVVPTLDLRTDRDDFAPLKDHFVTEVSGYLTITGPGTYALRLVSDDGAKLWIDGRLLIDHDGHHGPTPKDGKLELTAGEHELRISHFNNWGDGALALQWQPPGAAADRFDVVPAAALSHTADVSRETSQGKKRIIPPLRRGLPGDGTPVPGMHPGFKYEATDVAVAEAALAKVSSTPPYDTPSQEIITWLPDPPHQKLACRVHEENLEQFNEGGATEPKGYLDKQWIGGNQYNGTLHRLFLDDVSGGINVVAFRLASGLGNDVTCFFTGPDKAKYFSAEPLWRKDHGPVSKVWRLERSGQPVFEILLVRALTNGFEIEFTKPLDPRCGWEADSYYVEQWLFDLKSEISNLKSHPPRRDGIRYPVKSASVSPDRKKVFLEIENLKESHVVYIRLLPPCISEDGERPWSTEAWYTLNAIPKDRFGKVLTPPEPEPRNFLTAEEKAAGWKLLFDGRTTAGWRGYKKDRLPAGWIVKDGCIVRVGSGGDICTAEQFDNFELQLEWRIAAAGNSGIFYRVSEKYGWPWESGPEMQVLDNAEHADGRNPKTSAASNYALHAPARDVTQPVGFFNKARIVADGKHIEHWLNGVKVVEYELGSPEWQDLVAASKFAKWPDYGRVRKGHIVLQDHGDQVWYRNIKIRPLGGE